MSRSSTLPHLKLSNWEDTKNTLHLYSQIVGKIRLKSMPKQNHWWHVPLYINTRGFGTRMMPNGDQNFEINFDFIDHELSVLTDSGEDFSFNMKDALSVAEFYDHLFDGLNELGVEVEILDRPYDHEITKPFKEIREYDTYDSRYIERYWQVLKFTDRTFKKACSKFVGKTCPVQLYWHSFDLAMTRFSGEPGPEMANAGQVEREAYSHEVISFGFWPGDGNVRYPAYYSYTYPAPEGLEKMPLNPKGAEWVMQNNSPMALLAYKKVRKASDPQSALMEFISSAYSAGAEKAGWNVEKLNRVEITD